MIIKDIRLINFGKFHDTEIHFERGLNIVYGENEAGKTTIHTFIRGMLFGIDKQRGKASGKDTYTKYEPWINPEVYRELKTMVRTIVLKEILIKMKNHFVS